MDAKQKGQEWLQTNQPEWAKAVIIARLEQSDSDLYTDYYASHTVRTVVLAWSKHTRDLFSEMRKAADLFPETHHLGTGKGEFRIIMLPNPEDRCDYPKNFLKGDRNSYPTYEEALAVAEKYAEEDRSNREKMKAGEISCFCPHLPFGYEIKGSEKEIEHREKYSMGNGYYLGSDRYSGWQVSKVPLGDYKVAEAIGKGDHLLDKTGIKPSKPKAVKTQPEQVAIESPGNVAINHNQEKDGIELVFAGKPAETVRDAIKALGFRWSKFQGLWYARHSAELMQQVQALFSGEPVKLEQDPPIEDNQPRPNPAKAEKFRTLADSMQATIDHKKGDRLTNTHRRARMAASAWEDGERLERVQAALRILADQHEDGSIDPLLAKISSKSELIDLIPKALLCNATEEEAQYWGYQRYSIWTDDMLSKIFILDNWQDERSKLRKIGVTNLEELKAVLSALKQIFKPDPEVARQRELQKLEVEMGLLKIPGYFPTPQELAEKMVEYAGIRDGMKVLEPSAGKGNLCEAINKAATVDLHCCEISYTLRNFLIKKGFNVVESDFLDYAHDHLEEYDAIVANPPFENGQDVEHLQLMYKCLKPGGSLVCLVSEGPFFRSDRVSEGFRSWLDGLDHETEEIIDGFKQAERSTGIRCRIVTIRKAEAKPRPVNEPIDLLAWRREKCNTF